MATIAAEHEASIVATATMPMRRLPLPEAPKVEPGLKPNQPKARMKQPNRPRTRLWPGIGLTEPSLLYLPSRGPSTIAPARADQPPMACTTPEPAKSRYPWPRPILPSWLSQPPPQAQLPKMGYTMVEMNKP